MQRVFQARNRPGVSLISVTLAQSALTQTHRTTHDVEHEDARAIGAVEDAAGSLDTLPVTSLPKLGWARPTLRLLRELLAVLKDSPNQTSRRLRLIESDVIGDGVEILESRFCSD